VHDTDRTCASIVDRTLADLGSEFEAEYEDEEAYEDGYPTISCVTPGDPYVLHCFPSFGTDLTKEHHHHLGVIADEIRRSFATRRKARQIRNVVIVGHSSTWHETSHEELTARAIERAANAAEQLVLRLRGMGLDGKVNVHTDGLADKIPWRGRPYSSTRGDQVAQNDRALNRRVEIYLFRGPRIVKAPYRP
jgi:hypothetical protein